MTFGQSPNKQSAVYCACLLGHGKAVCDERERLDKEESESGSWGCVRGIRRQGLSIFADRRDDVRTRGAFAGKRTRLFEMGRRERKETSSLVCLPGEMITIVKRVLGYGKKKEKREKRKRRKCFGGSETDDPRGVVGWPNEN